MKTEIKERRKAILSKAFLRKMDENRPFHKLAWASGLSPNQLYRITAGIDRPDRDDPRIAKLATYLGMTIDDCFEVQEIRGE